METYQTTDSSAKFETVLTVPMRNGNTQLESYLAEGTDCSYRTYEEWKQEWIKELFGIEVGSYRTYEEWKHSRNTME